MVGPVAEHPVAVAPNLCNHLRACPACRCLMVGVSSTWSHLVAEHLQPDGTRLCSIHKVGSVQGCPVAGDPLHVNPDWDRGPVVEYPQANGTLSQSCLRWQTHFGEIVFRGKVTFRGEVTVPGKIIFLGGITLLSKYAVCSKVDLRVPLRQSCLPWQHHLCSKAAVLSNITVFGELPYSAKLPSIAKLPSSASW
jgi:hypothetical protein